MAGLGVLLPDGEGRHEDHLRLGPEGGRRVQRVPGGAEPPEGAAALPRQGDQLVSQGRDAGDQIVLVKVPVAGGFLPGFAVDQAQALRGDAEELLRPHSGETDVLEPAHGVPLPRPSAGDALGNPAKEGEQPLPVGGLRLKKIVHGGQ